jgi:hypothetical protein
VYKIASRALGVVALAAAATVGTGSAAEAGSTGDGAAIRLFRAAAAITNAQPAMQVVQSGYMAETAHVGSPMSFAYRWGFGTLPPGYVRSTETITYTQHRGRVVWLTDVLSAPVPACRQVSACPQLAPIELFVTRVAAFAGVVDGPGGTVACYTREPVANVPYRAGGRWWTAVGDFHPLIVRGNQALVTVTYEWADGQHVIERDSIDASTRLFSASIFHVGTGAKGSEPSFSFAQKDTALSYAPPAPKVSICR